MPVWAQALLRLVVAVLAFFRRESARSRTDAVRADPGGEWVRKFGGSDKRASPGTDDAGSRSDG